MKVENLPQVQLTRFRHVIEGSKLYTSTYQPGKLNNQKYPIENEQLQQLHSCTIEELSGILIERHSVQ
jgi:hypothetical protein